MEEIKAEWVNSQKKTFTKWFNNKLRPKGHPSIENCTEAFEDGVMLMRIVNALYDIPIPKYNANPKMRPHKLDNISLALTMVDQAQIKTNFLKREHLIDKDEKMILGMMWAIILDYAIKGISVDEATAKEGLLLWCRKKTAGYRDVDPPGVQNFSQSWKSGMALCALIHRHRPELIDYDSLVKTEDAKNLELAFSVAEKHLDIPRLLDVEDLTGTERPDERSVMTYISEFFHRFAGQEQKEKAAKRVQNLLRFIRSIEAQQADYESRARALVQWANSQSESLSESKFGDSLEHAVDAFASFRNYLVNEKPQKVGEKIDVESLFAQVQTELLVNNRRPYTPPQDATPEALDEAFNRLTHVERERGQAVRANRFKFIRKEERSLPQEKIDEFTAAFKHFDKNNNGFLDKIEFKAALSALGVAFKDDAAVAEVFARVSQGGANITLDQYIEYCRQREEDKDSPEQIKASFQEMSDQGHFITASQLNTPPLSADEVAYLKERIPQTADGQYDYSAYVSQQFN